MITILRRNMFLNNFPVELNAKQLKFVNKNSDSHGSITWLGIGADCHETNSHVRITVVTKCYL